MKWKHEDNRSKSNVIAAKYGMVTFVAQRANSAFLSTWSASIYDRKTFFSFRLGFFASRKDAMYAVEQYLEHSVVVLPLDIVVNPDPQEVAPNKSDPRPEAYAKANAERKKGGKH